ncbi:hypothetical protein IMSHALPRED_005733 [Imshaugia aleurites]|uniref:Uncharacterized protein n=1 Tax=Imshaugia aleurites TaxID=172621 RepID=A0A8H3IKW8_9LECA|nr:hypothetical protein IMSHALPRED_005733 [Imshaugia aleurites]
MANLNSLPREVRDQIYDQVLVSPLPIQFSNVLGPIVYDPDFLGPMAILFAWASNLQIADEACEVFYQKNTFSVHCEDLPTFLGAKIHRMLSIDTSRFMDKPEPTCIRPFDAKEWVTSLSVTVEEATTRYSRYLAYELRYLLDCPRLRKLTIRNGRTTVLSWETEWTGVLRELQLKMGDGLKVIYSGQSLNLPYSPYPGPTQAFGALSAESFRDGGDGDGDGDVNVGDPGEEVAKGGEE